MSGVARPSRCRAFRILRVDYLPRRSTGAGLHVAKEMGLVRRSGPDGSLTSRTETVTILTQSVFSVNVVLHKHVCYINMFAEIDLRLSGNCNLRLMADFDDLYRELGRKIRQARERQGQKLSQGALAQRLGISRASMVNIEAGRQHAPLHLLWQIAELLGSDLTLLIPSRDELLATSNTVELEKAMMKQIEDFAKGDSARIKLLTGFASKLNATIETPRADRKSHEQRKPRS